MKSISTGKLQTGTKLAEFCAHALLILEVLIHPRALPFVNANDISFGEAQCNFQGEYIRQNNITTFDLPRAGHDTFDPDDDLCARWLVNDNEVDASLAKDTKYPEGAAEGRNEMVSEAATNLDAEMIAIGDENIFNSDQPISCTANIPVAKARTSVATEIVSKRVVSDSTMPRGEGSHIESGQGSSANKTVELASQSSLLQATEGSSVLHGFTFELGHGGLLDDEDDPFPDIVDEDPDSDFD
ncbi:hypothetical protein RIF29_33995 [Crotalaria pallida]|uniref:Uncharacterized protein n=1 Tax=Crotalaria pallida TaxID=3830 RepID=A0AAN9HTA5_CROPI